MNFLNPGLAAIGLACIAVPILIHILMRRRRRPVPWGAMQFLLAAYRQQRRRMNLEQWLLLASRCLIVALIALAIGKPVLAALGAAEGIRARTVYILLDNSLTSQTSTSPGTASSGEFTALKESARTLLSTLSPGRGDRAALITLAGPARADVLPAAPDAAQVAQLVERTQPAASRADIEGALRLTRQAIQEEKDAAGSEAVVVVLSPFRSGAMDLARTLESLSTTSRPVRVIAESPAQTVADNVTIARAQPLRPLLITGDAGAAGPGTGSIPVRIELTRSGSLAQGVTQVRAWLASSGTQPPAQTAVVAWTPGQRTATAFVTLDARAATQDATLSVETDADALLGDNTFIRPIESVSTLRVALITPTLSAGASAIDTFASQDWLALALSPQTPNPLRAADASGIRLETVDPARLTAGAAAELSGAATIVVTQPHTLDAGGWRAIAAAAERGSFLIIVPPEAEAAHTWIDACVQALALPLSLSREPTSVGGDEGLALAPQSTLPPDEDLLALVRPELEELVKPVRVRKVLTLQPRSESAGTPAPATLLALADGTPFMISARTPSGSLVALWLAPPALSWTDLPAKPLMVPLLQELVRQGAGRSGPQRTLTAGNALRAVTGATELASTDGASLIRIAGDGTPLEPLRSQGLWNLRANDGRTLSTLAVNHDPAAGDTTPQRAEDVERWLSGLSREVSLLTSAPTGEAPAQSALSARRSAPPISFPLLIAAGAVALLELLLARWFSHAKVETSAGTAATATTSTTGSAAA
ncbi:MAG TPA: BatA domain-containing protein [Phycisphaerales bacterium]|nr:BatA domain-containing protein [Phycisphaerales bacterium]